MSENETILDIEMGLRARAEEMAKHLGDQHTYVEQDLRLASRIQEARKRQEETHQKELDALNEQIADLRQQRDLWSKRAAELVEKCNEQYAKLKQVGNAAKLREMLEEVLDDYQDDCAMSRMIRAALAAPPRNCERFQTVKQAKKAYCAEVRHVFVWDGCETERLVDWLLALETEKEGGAK